MKNDDLHPVHEVYDGMINSYISKTKISIINPTPAMINLNDMAKAGSNICRFGGQINNFYSVAKHTLLVWWLAPPELKPQALLHDLASEPYLGDVIKPLKVLLDAIYSPLEDNFMTVVCSKYNVNYNYLKDIKTYDLMALEIEHTWFAYGDPRFNKAFREINQLLGIESAYAQLLKLLKQEFGKYER